MLGGVLIALLVVLALATTVDLLSAGERLFLAGRLDDPVGYRNATACLFGLSFWPLVSAGAHHRLPALLRGGVLSAATLTLGLAFLTQARGVVLGLGVGALIALGLGPDRLRRALAAIVVLAALGLASGALLDPYHAFTDGGEAGADEVSTAMTALLLAALGVFAVGLAAALLDGGLRLDGRVRASLRTVGAVAVVVGACGALVAAVAATGDPVSSSTSGSTNFAVSRRRRAARAG